MPTLCGLTKRFRIASRSGGVDHSGCDRHVAAIEPFEPPVIALQTLQSVCQLSSPYGKNVLIRGSVHSA